MSDHEELEPWECPCGRSFRPGTGCPNDVVDGRTLTRAAKDALLQHHPDASCDECQQELADCWCGEERADERAFDNATERWANNYMGW